MIAPVARTSFAPPPKPGLRARSHAESGADTAPPPATARSGRSRRRGLALPAEERSANAAAGLDLEATVAVVLPQPNPPRSDRSEETLGALRDAVVRVDATGRVEYRNAAAVALCGELPPGFPLAAHLRFVDEKSGQELPNPLARALAERATVSTGEEALLLRPDGADVPVSGTVTPLLDAAGVASGAVIFLRDRSRARELARELDHLARHDALTGVANRREFERQLGEVVDLATIDGREHSLLYLDLDHMKLVNDTCGHLAGDRLLSQVAELLASRLRRRDCLARLGGDEFGILLLDCAGDCAARIAEEIRERVRGFRFEWEGQAFDVGVSIGLVPIHAGSGGLDDVLRAADAACYVVKDAGGNGVHRFSLDDTLIGRRQSEMVWVRQVQQAIDEERLRLHYQLIYPLSGGQPMCELFVRMLGRDGSLHRAAAFVPAAERFGLMVDLDRWVIRQAFRVIAESTANERHRPASEPGIGSFAINLSAHSLSDDSFLEFVFHELEATGIFPEKLCFEITETAAIRNLSHARRIIAALKEIGCRFALDDFGRGLSSFAYLRDLNVDLLKIDADFVRGLADDSVSRALVASIHQVGQVLGLETIAEGVESEPTLAVLREIGIEFAQGYLLHRPQAVVRV